MLRHIVLWNFKQDFSDAEKVQIAKQVKEQLEQLKTSIDCIKEMTVYINPLATSTRDVMLDSVFEDENALNIYQQHPDHQKVAAFIGTVMKDRVCFDC